jgi:hypothetical protein
MARTGPRSEPTTRHPPDAEHLPAPTNTPTTDAGRAGGRPTPRPPRTATSKLRPERLPQRHCLSPTTSPTYPMDRQVPTTSHPAHDAARTQAQRRSGVNYARCLDDASYLLGAPSPADAGIPAAPAKLPAAPISCTATRPIAGAPGPDHAGDAGQRHPVRCGPVTGWKHDPERRCSDSGAAPVEGRHAAVGIVMTV